MGSARYEELYGEYQRLFDSCTIRQEKEKDLDKIIARMERDMTRYQKLEERLGIPWYFIAVIHERESSGRFKEHLHNGDPLTAPTVHRPAGRPPTGGPSFSWEESAQDALRLKDLDEWTDWRVPGLLYQLEKYNGFGYRLYYEDVLSPYLWSFSTHYLVGKYDRDGHFDPDLVDQQAGAATLLRRLVDLKKDYVADLGAPRVPSPPPQVGEPAATKTYTVIRGDTLTKIAQKFSLTSWRELWRANREDIPNPNLIRVGQELAIPASRPPGPPGPSAQAETASYTTRAGDTLTKIAKFFGITLGDLLRLNPELIKPGTVIKVPKLSEEYTSIHASLVPGQEPLWLEIAQREIGVAEFDPGENPRIIEYLKTTSYPDPREDEIHWCAAFVNWCISQANLKPKGSARALNWLDWGQELDEPRPGCVVVLRTTVGHHVAFFVKKQGDYLRLLGGNQRDAVNIESFPSSWVLGYRWPQGTPG